MADRTIDSSLFVIFGASGDLSRRKILPALYRLHATGQLPANTVVLGVSRDPEWTDADFRAAARAAITTRGDADESDVTAWIDARLFFHPVRADEPDLAALRARIEELEQRFDLPGNRGIYLSIPPGAVGSTATMLGAAGLNRSPGWTRLVVEKPFGRDLASACALNALLHEHFDESQIYRIDHYLGKETVQNLLVFRFANDMFETLWNRDHIDSVKITVAEAVGVERRAGYYETAGALRDMVQSHLTQLVALVGMEVPSAIEPDAIRAEKLKVLRSIRPPGPEDVVFGQYGPGTVDGAPVPGYVAEPGVAPDSRIETFVALRLHIENWRWQGVPFYLRTGKRLPRRLTEIEIAFRREPVALFGANTAGTTHRNSLVLTLQPNEGFCLYFDIKAPGEPFRIQQLPLHFSYAEAFDDLPGAYETLLLDLLAGDPTLFVHADEVEKSWSLYTPLLTHLPEMHAYPAGSWGPDEALRIAPP